MRQVAIDAASIPKDAKIAVLEKTSAESEKMIAEARSDKLKQNAEIQQTHKKMSDMENQLKALQNQLMERDSIIKILQNRNFEHNVENVLSIPIQDSTQSLILHSKQVVLTLLTHVTISILSLSVITRITWSPHWDWSHVSPGCVTHSPTVHTCDRCHQASDTNQGQCCSGLL